MQSIFFLHPSASPVSLLSRSRVPDLWDLRLDDLRGGTDVIILEIVENKCTRLGSLQNHTSTQPVEKLPSENMMSSTFDHGAKGAGDSCS